MASLLPVREISPFEFQQSGPSQASKMDLFTGVASDF